MVSRQMTFNGKTVDLLGFAPAAMPLTEPSGFTRVWSEDFTTPAALGSFIPKGWDAGGDAGRLPDGHPYAGRIKCYVDNSGYSGDLNNGKYYSSKVFSAQTGVPNANGVLDEYIHLEDLGDGVQRLLSGWFIPDLARGEFFRYGRFSIRMRADRMVGVGGVHLLIPDTWPQDGEFDWAEGAFTEVPVGGYDHFADPLATAQTSGNFQQPVAGLVGSSWQDWHIYTIEWTPGRKRWLMDGVLRYDSTDRVSTAQQKYVPFQSGINGYSVPPAGTSGHIQIDWATAADYTG